MNSALYTALYSRLSGGTALTSLIGGTASPRIYKDMAPEGTTLPYVVFSWAGGGYEPTSPHVDGNGVIRVRAFSSTSASSAGSIAAAVFTLLDRLPLTITGWNNSWIAGESPHIELFELDESGLVIWSSGDDYRVRIDKS